MANRVRLVKVPSSKILQFFRWTLRAGDRTQFRGPGVPPGTEVASVSIEGDCLLVELTNDLFEPTPAGAGIPTLDLEF
jgi:hypothetical protein